MSVVGFQTFAIAIAIAIAILIKNITITITITWICPIKSAVGFKIVARSPSEGFVASEEIRYAVFSDAVGS